jgi:hypothetical protein
MATCRRRCQHRVPFGRPFGCFKATTACACGRLLALEIAADTPATRDQQEPDTRVPPEPVTAAGRHFSLAAPALL